ncbi:unnamed protein product [Trichobilharzia regenti]|nr:unnamed protein product [Trichobilharzia regenti]
MTKRREFDPPVPTRMGKHKRSKGPDSANKLPQVTPHTRCKLRLLKMERIKDFLLMEEEFIKNQERLKTDEERHEVHAVVGVLTDETDPMVTVIKLEKAPQETYADIGGLDVQIQEIKESVELPLTHPELYEEMGIKPPKGVILYGAPGTGKTASLSHVFNE